MAQTYIVKSGDTLSGIASQHGVGVSDVTGFRSGDPNLIFPGETLTIGGGGTAPSGGSSTQPIPASFNPNISTESGPAYADPNTGIIYINTTAGAVPIESLPSGQGSRFNIIPQEGGSAARFDISSQPQPIQGSSGGGFSAPANLDLSKFSFNQGSGQITALSGQGGLSGAGQLSGSSGGFSPLATTGRQGAAGAGNNISTLLGPAMAIGGRVFQDGADITEELEEERKRRLGTQTTDAFGAFSTPLAIGGAQGATPSDQFGAAVGQGVSDADFGQFGRQFFGDTQDLAQIQAGLDKLFQIGAERGFTPEEAKALDTLLEGLSERLAQRIGEENPINLDDLFIQPDDFDVDEEAKRRIARSKSLQIEHGIPQLQEQIIKSLQRVQAATEAFDIIIEQIRGNANIPKGLAQRELDRAEETFSKIITREQNSANLLQTQLRIAVDNYNVEIGIFEQVEAEGRVREKERRALAKQQVQLMLSQGVFGQLTNDELRQMAEETGMSFKALRIVRDEANKPGGFKSSDIITNIETRGSRKFVVARVKATGQILWESPAGAASGSVSVVPIADPTTGFIRWFKVTVRGQEPTFQDAITGQDVPPEEVQTKSGSGGGISLDIGALLGAEEESF